MTAMEFAVFRQDRADGTVLTVQDDLDIATVEVLRREVAASLDDAPVSLLLDLTPATFLDSTGWRELVRAVKAGARTGVDVALVAPVDNWRVRKVLDMLRLGDLLTVHEQLPPG